MYAVTGVFGYHIEPVTWTAGGTKTAHEAPKLMNVCAESVVA